MLFTDVQRSVRLNKKKKSTNTSPYPDEVIDRLARAFYRPSLPAGTVRKVSGSLPRGRRNRLILQPKKNRKFPLGNSLPYLSCVDFCRVRPGGRTLFLFVLISSESALRSEQR